MNYPPEFAARVKSACPRCSGRLSYMTNIKADEDWQQNITGDKPSAVRSDAPGDAVVDWSPHPDDDTCAVLYRDDTDTTHVRQKDLQNLHYYPETNDVVKLNGKYYELMGYDKKLFLWWIEQIVVAYEVAQMDLPMTWERHEVIIADGVELIVEMPPPWELTDGDPED